MLFVFSSLVMGHLIIFLMKYFSPSILKILQCMKDLQIFRVFLKPNPERYSDFDSDVENNSSSGSENSISDLSPEIDEVIYENVNQFWIFTLADGRLYSRETKYRL